jgi:hypothetical protein
MCLHAVIKVYLRRKSSCTTLMGAEQSSADSLMVGKRFVSQNLFSFSFLFVTSSKDAHYAYPTQKILHDNSRNGQLFTKFPRLEFLLPMTPPKVISANDQCI